MDAFVLAVTIVLALALGFIPFLFKAGAEGRLRRGVGWYTDFRERPEGPLPAHRREPRRMGAQSAMIRAWTLCGAGLLLLAAIAWPVLGVPLLGIAIGIFGLAFIGLAVEARRENRWIRRDDPGERLGS
jgi:hypothetical protein